MLQITDCHRVCKLEPVDASHPGVADDASGWSIRRVGVDDRPDQVSLPVFGEVAELSQDWKSDGFKLKFPPVLDP